MKNNKIRLALQVACIVAIIAVGGITFTYLNTAKNPIKSKQDVVTITVGEGEGLYSLLNKLENEDIIKNKVFIKLYLKLNNDDSNIVPGTYTVDSSVSLNELLKVLKTEDTSKNQVKVTIPEGYNIEQMGEKFEEAKLFTKEEWLSAVKSYKTPSFVKNSDKTRYSLEGYLYADTYMFKNDAKPNDVIEIMLTKFKAIIEQVQKETGKAISENDMSRIITIASLIEEESRIDEDRNQISSVIYNRLNKGMKLQLDATVLYAHGKHLEKVYYKDLEIQSPYNTYYVNALPIGPIASPGIKSIKAAVQPDNTDYLYYLLTPDKKSHYFTDDYNDFLNKKREFGYGE